MGIIQQKRPFAPRPEVRETEYGAQYVKAATESSNDDAPKTEEPVIEESAVAEAPVVEDMPAKPERKKGGRPKKTKA